MDVEIVHFPETKVAVVEHRREKCTGFPAIFHYVNVGPQVQEKYMITDVYLPIL